MQIVELLLGALLLFYLVFDFIRIYFLRERNTVFWMFVFGAVGLTFGPYLFIKYGISLAKGHSNFIISLNYFAGSIIFGISSLFYLLRFFAVASGKKERFW